MVTPGSSSSKAYDHYSLVRTIENNFGLGNLGRTDSTAGRNDAIASPISDIWK